MLIEDHDGAYCWARARQLRHAGFEVAVCEGPDPAHAVDCTLLHDGHCDLADQADVIMCNIKSSHGGAELLAALHDHVRDTPILRECGLQERARDAAMLEGVTVVSLPATRTALVGAIDSVLPRR